MLQQNKPDDYVIATGVTRSVRDFVQAAIQAAGLRGSVENYVDFDDSMIRPAEVDLLIGDYSKAKNVLGWEPKTTFEELVKIMVENDLELEHLGLKEI